MRFYGFLHTVLERVIEGRQERACRRAMQDARFREIQQLIGRPDGSIVLDSAEDFDLWEEQTQIFDRINPAPWYRRLRWLWERVATKGV